MRTVTINETRSSEPTSIPGIRYFSTPSDARITRLDGGLDMPCGDMQLPLLEEDFPAALGNTLPYDVIGRGIYHALRHNPDCAFGDRYARLLKDGYPHFIAELASQIVMLDKKDVEVPYLDRKINYLKIFALIEPENAAIPRGIGRTFLEKGLRLSALDQTTVTLYRAETFTRRALDLDPEDLIARLQLGEICYLLGKYTEAGQVWRAVRADLAPAEREQVERRLVNLEAGRVPLVPAVDYLQALGFALACHQQGEHEEAAAILQDILADEVFVAEFPLPEIYYILGSCCQRLDFPRYAEEYLAEALRLDPGYAEAQRALADLKG
jgi:tetratricopeptide (TPR) repeat protein